jgi:hypothetical protein
MNAHLTKREIIFCMACSAFIGFCAAIALVKELA